MGSRCLVVVVVSNNNAHERLLRAVCVSKTEQQRNSSRCASKQMRKVASTGMTENGLARKDPSRSGAVLLLRSRDNAPPLTKIIVPVYHFAPSFLPSDTKRKRIEYILSVENLLSVDFRWSFFRLRLFFQSNCRPFFLSTDCCQPVTHVSLSIV